jgi:hypothetical protein
MTTTENRPLVYLSVMLPVLLVGGLGIVAALMAAYARFTGIAQHAVPRLNALLISLPTLILWIPLALLLGNCVLYLIPRLRTAAERYADESGHAGCRDSQRQLAIAAIVMALVCLPLITLGFLL